MKFIHIAFALLLIIALGRAHAAEILDPATVTPIEFDTGYTVAPLHVVRFANTYTVAVAYTSWESFGVQTFSLNEVIDGKITQTGVGDPAVTGVRPVLVPPIDATVLSAEEIDARLEQFRNDLNAAMVILSEYYEPGGTPIDPIDPDDPVWTQIENSIKGWSTSIVDGVPTFL